MADILELNKLSYVVVLGVSVYNLATGIIEPTVAPYLEILGSSSEQIGTILSVRWLIVAILSIPFALLSNKIGKIRILQLSTVFSIISGYILWFWEGANAVYYFYIMIGFAAAASSGPGAAILAENEGSKRVAAFALFSVTYMIPPAIGSAISAYWFRYTDTYTVSNLSSIFVTVFFVQIIGCFIYLALLYFSSETKVSKAEQIGINREFRILFAPVVALSIILLMLVNFLSGAGAGATLPFLPPYLKSLGASPTELSLLVLALNLSMGVVTQLSAPLAKRFGDLKVYVVATLLSVVCLVGMVFTEELIVAAVFYILRGTFANMNNPIGQSRTLSYVDRKVRATGSAMATNIRWVGWVIFSPISGNIIDTRGYQVSFVFTAVLYVIATALFVWVNLTRRSLEDMRIEID